MKPFLAFVGDNNSGKSYLLSLIWGIFTIGRRNLYRNADVLQTPEWKICREWLISTYETEEGLDLDIKGHRTLINTVLNQLLERNKDNFIRELFNFNGMAIKKLEIELSEEIMLELHTVWEDDKKNEALYLCNCDKKSTDVGFFQPGKENCMKKRVDRIMIGMST